MIVIEPVEIQPRSRYPAPYELPVIIPPSPDVPYFTPPPERKSSLWLLAAIIAGVLLSESESPGKLGGAAAPRKKSPGNKLLYMWIPPGKWFDEAISIPKGKLWEYQQKVIATQSDRKPGRLFYIWSESAGYARWQLTQDATTRHKWTPTWERSKRPPEGTESQLTLFGSAQLSGDVVNCAIWLPDDYGGYKCGGYARVCEPPTCAETPDTKIKQIKVCSKNQRIFSSFYNRLITRCKRYKAACTGAACMTAPMPYPDAPPERTEPSGSEVESMAQWMAEEYNRETFDKEPLFAREILDRGGIRSYKKGAEKEEYKGIPLFMKNRQGLPLDEMASEMKFDTSRDLVEAIVKAYPIKAKGKWKKLQRKTWEDFENEAFEMIEQGMKAGTWAGLTPAQRQAREEWIARHEAPGTWRRMWKVPGQKPKQITPDEAYILMRDTPDDGEMYLLRATSAAEARRLIATGKFEPVESGQPRRQKRTPEQLQLLGQDLFPDLRRELILEPPEDAATSDDPVTACMERQGWRIPRIEELKASISEKTTPDLFTGKIKKLSAAEKEYQRVVDECLESRSGTAGLVLGRSAYSETTEDTSPWMLDQPFTEKDNHDYNRYSHYTSDLNEEFTANVQKKAEEVTARMKTYGIKEISEEVETALRWHRRRTYEYLRRMIYSRNQAPGAAMVGPSKYNWRKHEKVMSADKKYLDKLDQSARKLATATRKIGKGATKPVAVSDTEKWEHIAVVTKRNRFGVLVQNNYIANPNDREDQAQNIKALDLTNPKSTFRPVIRKKARDLHAKLIAAAFAKGVRIEPEVLAEYPDLKPGPIKFIPQLEPVFYPGQRPLFREPEQLKLLGAAK